MSVNSFEDKICWWKKKSFESCVYYKRQYCYRAAVCITENQERFYLYLILSITAGLLLFLGLVIGRLLVQRHRARREAKFHATAAAEHTLPNGFADDISEIDADIDLTVTPVPVVAVHSPPGSVAEVVRYGSGAQGTLRRGQVDQDVGPPRSLNRGGNSQYYYGWPELSGGSLVPPPPPPAPPAPGPSSGICPGTRTYCF